MYETLMEEAVSEESYGKALKAVIANKGAPGRVPFVSAYPMSGGFAPGIDGMTTEELNGHLLKHFPKIHRKLMAGTSRPAPRRRKEKSKPSEGNARVCMQH